MSCTQLFAHLEIPYYLKDDNFNKDRIGKILLVVNRISSRSGTKTFHSWRSFEKEEGKIGLSRFENWKDYFNASVANYCKFFHF